ncbi:MAG: histone deacetylase [Burkholderiales bacterium]|nr:histone deacetylase [Phycisphaerae bacterium]
MGRITAYHSPGFAAPIGDHLMPIGKFQLVADAVRGWDFVDIRVPEPVSEADVLRVHDRRYVEAVKTGLPRELAESQKFPWSPLLYPSVLLTSGGVYAAAKQALIDGSAAALASGFHHAGPAHGEGFCTFNGLVIAIDRLMHEGAIRTAAVLDMDLHYGNGTAICCRGRPYISQLSIYGNDYWDNAVYRDVTTRHHQDGANHRSAALPAGCDRATMLAIMNEHLPYLLERAKPDLLLYQAGADPYYEDPFSPLKLNHDDLLARDRAVFRFAKDNALPVAWVLAGGYTRDTSKVVKVHTNTFLAWREVYG